MGDRQLISFLIEGNSMNPLLRDGDQILVKTQAHYECGDVVVATHPIQTDLIIVKRITSISDEGFTLRGDNEIESSDKFGRVHPSNIIGKYVSKRV